MDSFNYVQLVDFKLEPVKRDWRQMKACFFVSHS